MADLLRPLVVTLCDRDSVVAENDRLLPGAVKPFTLSGSDVTTVSCNGWHKNDLCVVCTCVFSIALFHPDLFDKSSKCYTVLA